MSHTWGDDLYLAVHDLADPDRVDRGRDLYDSNAVVERWIEPGFLRGVVAGDTDHGCSIRFTTLDESQVALLLSFLHHFPSGRSAHFLLSTLELALATRGVDLGPSEPLDASCSCSDDEEFCQHVVALSMDFADVVDESPWTWLQARGLVLDVPGARASGAHVPPPEPEPAPTPEPTLEDELATYWSAGPPPQVAQVPRPAFRERDRAVLAQALTPTFAVRGRSRGRAAVLADDAARGFEELYLELVDAAEPSLPSPRPRPE